MTRRGYRLLIPPLELAEKSHRGWSKEEADAYFEWLVKAVPDRIGYLLRFMGFDGREIDRQLLIELGKEVTRVLPSDAYSRASDGGAHNLSDHGYALAADMGLLTARLLLERAPAQVKWEILRKPRSDMSYNLPVLTGFGGLSLDPVGGSIAEANGVLLGRRGPDAWVRILDYWSEKVE